MSSTVVRRVANNPFHTTLYNMIFRNTATLTAFVIGGAFVGEMVVDSAINSAWNVSNRGVRYYCAPV